MTQPRRQCRTCLLSLAPLQFRTLVLSPASTAAVNARDQFRQKAFLHRVGIVSIAHDGIILFYSRTVYAAGDIFKEKEHTLPYANSNCADKHATGH